jgi:flavin-dependent dehydrogenase
MRHDAVVVGGGPAGAAAAIGLALSGRSVLLVEQSRYKEWRVGETLPPVARLPLGELGVWDRFLSEGHLPSHAIQAVWGSAELYETDFIFNPYGTGWHVDRQRFDAMLASHAERCGAIVLTGSRVADTRWNHNRWEVRIVGPSSRVAHTSFLVDATGRAARISRWNGSSRIILDRMIGIVALYRQESAGVTADPVLLLEATEEGWWYSAPLPCGSLLVAYLTDPDLFSRSGLSKIAFWLERLERATKTAARTDGFRWDGQMRVKAAGTGRSMPAGGPGWIAVGDAAAAHDPLAADGVTRALLQGLSAAAAIQDTAGGPVQYAQSVKDAFEEYLEQRCEYYRRETRWPDSLFWQRRRLPPAETEKSFDAY